MNKKQWICFGIVTCIALVLGVAAGYVYSNQTNPELEKETLEQEMKQELKQEAKDLVK